MQYRSTIILQFCSGDPGGGEHLKGSRTAVTVAAEMTQTFTFCIFSITSSIFHCMTFLKSGELSLRPYWAL